MSGGGPRWARRIGVRVGAPPQWLGLGAGVLALATVVSGLFGGLKEVDSERLPTVAVGAVHTGQPWNVTIVSVEYTKDASPLKLQKPGDRWLMVRATVEVTADESRSDIRDVLRLRNVAGLIGKGDELGAKPDQVYLRGDISHVQRLHPNLPEDLLFFWEQAGDVEPPREVEVTITGRPHQVSSITGHLEWLAPEPRALLRSALTTRDS